MGWKGTGGEAVKSFGRVMVAAGCLAALALAGVGALGYLGVAEDAGLTGHILMGMAAVLVLVLAHSWILFYLLGAARVLRETAGEAPLEPALGAFRTRVLPPLLGVVTAAVATFVLGIGAYAERSPVLLHGALFWITLALQAWAAVVEWRALAATERAATTPG